MWNGVPPQEPVFKNWSDADKRKKARSDCAAAKKAKIADRLDNNSMVIAAIKLHLDRISPGQWVDAEPILRECRTLPCIWKPYLYAARRVLGIKWRPGNGTVRRLPKDALRLRRLLGINSLEFRELALLPFTFNNCAALREFSGRVNVLDLMKGYLKSHAERLREAGMIALAPSDLMIEYTPPSPTLKAGVENLKKAIPIGWDEYLPDPPPEPPKDEDDGIGSLPGVVFG
jgi:hypothetical protein